MKKPLEQRKSRDAKRKLRRLEHERAMNKLKAAARKLVRRVRIDLVNRPSEDQVLLGVSSGAFSRTLGVTYPLNHEDLVGAYEDRAALAAIVNNVGLLALSSVLGYNLAAGPEGLARALCDFAGVDLAALKKDAETTEAPVSAPEAEGVVL